MRNVCYYLLLTIIGIVFGYYMRGEDVRREYDVRYVEGKPIEKVVEVKIPYKVEVPAKPIYIYKTDTLMAQVDTTAILNDWIVKRYYNQSLFNNEEGSLKIDAMVQYNQLQTLSYTFTPRQKEITHIREKTVTPYVGIGYNSLNYISLGGGLFYHNVGLDIKYTTNFNKNGVGLGLKYKF